jgi:hypothetical protein
MDVQENVAVWALSTLVISLGTVILVVLAYFYLLCLFNASLNFFQADFRYLCWLRMLSGVCRDKELSNSYTAMNFLISWLIDNLKPSV